MEGNKESKGWIAVPAFGEWDIKNGPVPDYSFDFSKIREIRKQNKIRGSSYGNEYELLQLHYNTIIRSKEVNADDDVNLSSSKPEDSGGRRRYLRAHYPSGIKRFINYFQCCRGAS